VTRTLLVVAVLGSLVLGAKLWDDWTIATCNARSTQEMEQYSRNWIATCAARPAARVRDTT